MTRDVASGTALIVGAVAGLLTMAFHPTGHEIAAAVGRDAGPARAALLVHVLAIASVPVLFFGAIGFTRRLSPDHGLAIGALVSYGFALVAVMCAALASGLIAPALIAAMVDAGERHRPALQAALAYNSALNQSFAAVYVALSSVAIGLWSLAILVRRTFPGLVGIMGLIVAVLLLSAFLSGRVRLNVHGFGLIILVQSAWLIAVGVLLCRGTRVTPLAGAV